MLRRQLENAPDAIVEMARNGQIVWANSKFLALFGYQLEELTGQLLDRLVPERLHMAHRQHRRAFFTNPKARIMGNGLDLRARHRDGSEFQVDVSLSPLSTGEDMTVMAVVRKLH